MKEHFKDIIDGFQNIFTDYKKEHEKLVSAFNEISELFDKQVISKETAKVVLTLMELEAKKFEEIIKRHTLKKEE